MDRGIFSFSLILVLTFGALFLLRSFASGEEFRRETTCYSDALQLDCGKLGLIAIHEAYFTTDHNRTCLPPSETEYIDDQSPTLNHTLCRDDVRVHINKRCSGLKNCTYSYNSQPGRKCFNPEGVLVVKYDCFIESSLNRFCNSKVTSGAGYIASPGFPSFYPALPECSWSLTASEGQTVQARLLHLHLRDAVEVPPPPPHPDEAPFAAFDVRPTPIEHRCDEDRLSAVHGIEALFTVCGDSEEALKEVEVDAGQGIELRFRSVEFNPAAGFLLYYKVLGCPSPIASEGSYILERNGSTAVVACRNHQVFNDTLETKRTLQCVRNHHWNDTLPPCITYEESTTVTMAPNNINEMVAHKNETASFFDKKTDLIVDIIVPSVLIGVLVLGNIIIVIIIFTIRRRNKPNENTFEEIVEPKTQPLVAEEEETDNI